MHICLLTWNLLLHLPLWLLPQRPLCLLPRPARQLMAPGEHFCAADMALNRQYLLWHPGLRSSQPNDSCCTLSIWQFRSTTLVYSLPFTMGLFSHGCAVRIRQKGHCQLEFEFTCTHAQCTLQYLQIRFTFTRQKLLSQFTLAVVKSPLVKCNAQMLC